MPRSHSREVRFHSASEIVQGQEEMRGEEQDEEIALALVSVPESCWNMRQMRDAGFVGLGVTNTIGVVLPRRGMRRRRAPGLPCRSRRRSNSANSVCG